MNNFIIGKMIELSLSFYFITFNIEIKYIECLKKKKLGLLKYFIGLIIFISSAIKRGKNLEGAIN